MSCLLTERQAFRSATPSRDDTVAGASDETAILDHSAENVQSLITEAMDASVDPLTMLRAAHGMIQQRVRPVYALSECQRASRTLRLRRGSCSQRMAILEAVARGSGISSRVRGLLVRGEFWEPRFPRLAPVLPARILLAWPEFQLPSGWTEISELFEGAPSAAPFHNAGSDTLFEALGRGVVSWRQPATCVCGDTELSDYVLRDLGLFASRDELFAEFGENLPGLMRRIVGPVLECIHAG